MFSPKGKHLQRGWPGRIEGDRVIQLAAQTLQSFFTGGGSAREHAEYPLAEVQLLAPVLHPQSIRFFDELSSFAFGNPAAVHGPNAEVVRWVVELALVPRITGMIGAEGELAAFTILAEWRDSARQPPKDRGERSRRYWPATVSREIFSVGEAV